MINKFYKYNTLLQLLSIPVSKLDNPNNILMIFINLINEITHFHSAYIVDENKNIILKNKNDNITNEFILTNAFYILLKNSKENIKTINFSYKNYNFLLVPLTYIHDFIGILILNLLDMQISEEQLSIINTLSSLASSTYYNIKLFSQLRNKERKQKELSKFLTKIFENLDILLIITDKKGNIIINNNKFEKVFNLNNIKSIKEINQDSIRQLLFNLLTEYIIKNKTTSKEILLNEKYYNIKLNPIEPKIKNEEKYYIFIITEISQEKEINKLKNIFNIKNNILNKIEHKIIRPIKEIKNKIEDKNIKNEITTILENFSNFLKLEKEINNILNVNLNLKKVNLPSFLYDIFYKLNKELNIDFNIENNLKYKDPTLFLDKNLFEKSINYIIFHFKPYLRKKLIHTKISKVNNTFNIILKLYIDYIYTPNFNELSLEIAKSIIKAHNKSDINLEYKDNKIFINILLSKN